MQSAGGCLSSIMLWLQYGGTIINNQPTYKRGELKKEERKGTDRHKVTLILNLISKRKSTLSPDILGKKL